MEQARTLKILWFAFMMSIAIFQVVVFATTPSGEAMDGATAATIVLAGLPSIGFGLLGVPMVMRTQPASSAWIIRFACIESFALFGFVASFASHLPAFSLGAAVVSWASLIAIFPTDERYTAWEVRRMEE